jgi:hypothetical protein
MNHGQYADSEVRSMSASFNAVTQSTIMKLSSNLAYTRSIHARTGYCATHWTL